MFEKPIEAILSQGGVWAALFIFACCVAGYLQRQLSSCWSDRLTESKALGEIIHINNTVNAALTATFEARTRAMEAANKAAEMAALELANVRKEIERLREDLTRGGWK